MTEASQALPAAVDVRAVVLVEGVSDQLALDALAARLGRDLAAESVAVVPMGGATNIRRFLGEYGPGGRNLRVAGLCDAREEHDVRRALAWAGMAQDGFYACDADLEDELIRALGTTTVEQVIAEQGERASFRTLQHQPAQRARTTAQQLHRFMGTRSGRKARYARALVDALDLTRVPGPLASVLAHV
jgi:OLD-like protein